MRTINKYKKDVERAFGVLRFENGKPETGSKGGSSEVFAWLTTTTPVPAKNLNI